MNRFIGRCLSRAANYCFIRMRPVSVKSTPEYYGLRPNVGSRVAVIDIGSNSVRLVVYEKNGRYPTPLFDERSNCQLGAQLDETGHLKQDRIDATLVTVTRLSLIHI